MLESLAPGRRRVALKLENEFVVAAPIAPTWKTLLDLERVAGCLPGATIESSEEPGSYLGTMRVKLGPVSMNYKGTATIESVDESSHTAVFAVTGKETRGQGSASATIRNHLVDEGGSTRVLVETELSITGRPAQFGRGIMQDVAASMLGDFSKRLSAMMTADGAPEPVPTAITPVPPPPAEVESLRVGGVVGKVVLGRIRGFFGRILGRG
jgi:carbon monoxide dehydrogenase subunit G